MPSFNQGPYLEAAIRSVLTQDYPDKELIVIDGGSTDQSAGIIRKYQSNLAYWVSEPDRGQAHALNKALAHATGDIIGWLNSDDCYLPGAFSRAAEAFRENPGALLVHGDRIMIDRDGNLSGWTALPAFDPATTGYVICSETTFWQKSCSDRLPFDETLRFAIDLDFFCQLYQPGRFIKLDSYLGAFRCHLENKSSTLEEVGRTETETRWKRIFRDHPDGWQNRPHPGKMRLLARFLLHPFTLALPYLHRRFVLGLRGMDQ